MLLRNRTGLFWTIVVPSGIYSALSILPVGAVLGEVEYSAYLLPGVIALTIMQGGIYSLAYWVTDLRDRGVIRQISVTPLNRFTLILSLLTARSLIMLLQALVLTAIGVIFFHVAIPGSLAWAAIFVVLGGFAFLPIGLLISTFARSYDAAAPITTALGLPFTFLGSVFYPIDLLPGYLQVIAKYLPITFLADGLRKIYLGSTAGLTYDFLWLIVWIVAILFLTTWRFRVED